jgi:hypothetical protein
MVGGDAQRARGAMLGGPVVDSMDDERRLRQEQPSEKADGGGTPPAGAEPRK